MNTLLHHEEKHGFALHHLSPVIGTEVHGIDIGSDLDEDVISFLSDLLVQRKVLFFRKQNITMDQHIAFASRFGELEVHPFTANNNDRPEVIHLKNGPDNKPSIDLWVYFLLFPQAFNRYLRSNIDNKSSMNLLVCFLKLILDI